jgi:uncharacterized membrane protein YdfJ with MMPL/SSD domain
VTERLARAATARPWLTVGIWAVVLVLSLGISAVLLGDALTSEGDVTSSPESKRATAAIEQAFPPTRSEIEKQASGVVVVHSASLTVDDPAFKRRVEALGGTLKEQGATNVASFYAGGDESMVSRDRHATELQIALGFDAESKVDGIAAAVQKLDDDPAYDAGVTGDDFVSADFDQLSQDDLRKGELFFGLPAALIILVLVFGAVVAGLVPVALALLSILVAVALTALVGQAFDLSVFVINMITGMGLALGIDYSLFILSRYREERIHGLAKHAAITTAGATASRAVFFSGSAFVLAMLGMTLVPDTILRSLAVGAILVGIVSVAAATTLLPAVLCLLGDRVNALRVPYFGRSVGRQDALEAHFWRRIVAVVLRAPVVSLVVAVTVLVAAALPVLSLETGSSGLATLPDRFPSKHGYLLLNEDFPGQTTYPVQIAVVGDAESSGLQQGIARLDRLLASRPLFGQPTSQVDSRGDLMLLTVPIAGDSHSKAAVAAVRDLRSDLVPAAFAGVRAEVLVGGDTAEAIDYTDLTSHWLPIVFVFVLGLSFILLTVAFRSIVVPATAIAMNLLSVGAAYGLLVLVFVKGWGNDLFGFEQVDSIEAWVPLFLFSVLFGLSMDYQVFLLSRIREKYSETGDNRLSVTFGITSTARLITGAALIIIAVFWGFARGELVMFQQMGFGIAVALLIDATVIRSVVVPATMTLLGRWNWYLPSWLEWLPDVRVEGGGERPRAAVTGT